MDEEAIGSDQWRTTVSTDELRQRFQDWPVHLKKAIEEVSDLHNYSDRPSQADPPCSCSVISRNNQQCTYGSIHQLPLTCPARYASWATPLTPPRRGKARELAWP